MTLARPVILSYLIWEGHEHESYGNLSIPLDRAALMHVRNKFMVIDDGDDDCSATWSSCRCQGNHGHCMDITLSSHGRCMVITW